MVAMVFCEWEMQIIAMVFCHVYAVYRNPCFDMPPLSCNQQELSAEVGDGDEDLVDVVCDGEEEVLVFAFVYKMLHEAVDWHLIHPEVDSQEDHRACITETEIVVLHGVLEDLLHGAGAARGVYHTAFGYGEDEILAGAVVEVLGDVCGEWGSGLMAI